MAGGGEALRRAGGGRPLPRRDQGLVRLGELRCHRGFLRRRRSCIAAGRSGLYQSSRRPPPCCPASTCPSLPRRARPPLSPSAWSRLRAPRDPLGHRFATPPKPESSGPSPGRPRPAGPRPRGPRPGCLGRCSGTSRARRRRARSASPSSPRPAFLNGTSFLYLQPSWARSSGSSADLVEDQPGEVMNVLLVGPDSRDRLEGADALQAGRAEDVSGQRSDTIMVLHIHPRQEQAAILSIPRASSCRSPAPPSPGSTPPSRSAVPRG